MGRDRIRVISSASRVVRATASCSASRAARTRPLGSMTMATAGNFSPAPLSPPGCTPPRMRYCRTPAPACSEASDPSFPVGFPWGCAGEQEHLRPQECQSTDPFREVGLIAKGHASDHIPHVDEARHVPGGENAFLLRAQVGLPIDGGIPSGANGQLGQVEGPELAALHHSNEEMNGVLPGHIPQGLDRGAVSGWAHASASGPKE